MFSRIAEPLEEEDDDDGGSGGGGGEADKRSDRQTASPSVVVVAAAAPPPPLSKTYAGGGVWPTAATSVDRSTPPTTIGGPALSRPRAAPRVIRPSADRVASRPAL